MLSLLTATLLVAQDAPPSTRPISPSHPSARLYSFDVAGVRLGMTAAEARAALGQAGFTPKPTLMDDSWEQDVRDAVNRRANKPVTYASRMRDARRLEAHGPRRQSIEVLFQKRPEGARVSNVTYRIPGDQITEADFYENVARRYGEPAALGGLGRKERRWCSRDEANCAHWGPLKQPHLRVGTEVVGPMYRIVLSGADADEDRERRAAMSAEVERRAPKSRETAF